jgi:hypothetical protein
MVFSFVQQQNARKARLFYVRYVRVYPEFLNAYVGSHKSKIEEIDDLMCIGRFNSSKIHSSSH